MERLDKFLCDCGVGTRSQVKAILKSGRVTVDGKAIKDGAQKVSDQQEICFDGDRIQKEGRVVLMMNKPAGFVTATEDAVERTVMELLPAEYKSKVKPVGRLDKQKNQFKLLVQFSKLIKEGYDVIVNEKAIGTMFIKNKEKYFKKLCEAEVKFI